MITVKTERKELMETMTDLMFQEKKVVVTFWSLKRKTEEVKVTPLETEELEEKKVTGERTKETREVNKKI